MSPANCDSRFIIITAMMDSPDEPYTPELLRRLVPDPASNHHTENVKTFSYKQVPISGKETLVFQVEPSLPDDQPNLGVYEATFKALITDSYHFKGETQDSAWCECDVS